MTPYTYLIGWSSEKLFYYGVRYARDCDPSDLWTKYFTSSKKVKELRCTLGEPDIVQVRKTFNSKADALAWEETVIRRMDAVHSESWVNLQNAGKTFVHDGHARDEVCRGKIRQARLDRIESDPEFRLACQARAREVGRRTDVRAKIGAKAKERFRDPDFAQKNIDSHNTAEYKMRTSENQRNLYASNESYREKHQASINTPEYRELQSKLSTERMADPENRAKVSVGLKAALSDPEKRKQMSEASKASTAKRLATRARNKALREAV